MPASTTEAKTQAFLHDEIRGWEAVDWVNQHTPEDARVAMLFSWPKLYLERAAVLGSVEDHVPSRVFLERHGEQSLQKLKSSGVTHLVVAGACDGCKNFLAKSYPFLSSSEFEEQFREPENLLRSLLIDDAAKVFESAKYSVWRLL